MAVPAASHGDPQNLGLANGNDPRLPADPLRRLEAELGEADGGRADDERLYAEAQGLVEEAWSLVTECLVLRDGLLDACREIEQTMEGIQQRLAGLPFTHETSGQAGGLGAERSGTDGPVVAPVNGAVTANNGSAANGVAQVNGAVTANNGSAANGAAPLNGADAVNGSGATF
ncbi:MAG TPA: hypothetical protein VGL68_01455 [Solirubrobacteraceae bacterium]